MMTTLDDLIDHLRADGDLDSKGEFTLDRERAREKMRHFQLADPRSYVLELVQAAVLARATEARFEIDADDMVLEFDGRPFAVQDFEQLYAAMFARRAARAAGALRQLAIGLNGALALDPRFVHVRSGGAQMEMRPGADDAVVPSEEPALAGTRIHVRDRFRGQTLVRFASKLRGDLAEVVFLRERCGWVTIPIYLGSEIISGETLLPDVLARVEVESPVKVVAGFADPEQAPAQIRIFKEGVWITTHEPADLPSDFVACVESSELEKDVSQRDVVRDEAYEATIAAVQSALFQTLEHLAERGNPLKEVKDVYRKALCHPVTLPLMKRWVAALRRPEDDGGPLAEQARKIGRMPLWAAARGAGGEVLSVLDLVELRARHGRVCWSRHPFPELPPDDGPPAVVVDLPRERFYLQELLGEDFYCAETELAEEMTRARNETRWCWRRMAPTIPAPRDPLVSMPLRSPEVTGEVGLFLDPSRHPQAELAFPLWLIKDGCLLGKRTLSQVIPGLAAALEADFHTSKTFAGPIVDRLYVRAALAVARALGPLMGELATLLLRRPEIARRYAVVPRRCLVPFLGMDWQGEGLMQLLKSFDVTSEEHCAYAWQCVERDPVAHFTAIDFEGENPPALARLPLFDTLHGPRVSLQEIAVVLRPEDGLRYLPRSGAYEDPAGEETVLLLDGAEIGALRQVFADLDLRDYSTAYVREVAAARHMRKPRIPHFPQGVVDIEIETDDGIRGRVGIRYPKPHETPASARLRLLKHDRHLDEIEWEVPFGPIAGVINDDVLTPSADWTRAKEDARLDRVRQLVSEQAAKLLLSLCESDLSADPVRSIVLSAATRVLSAKETRQGLDGELRRALASAPLFADLRGNPVDLRTIRDVIERSGELYYRPWNPGSRIKRREEAEVAGDRFVLQLTQRDYVALARVFGREALTDAREWLGTRQRAREIAAPLPSFEPASGEVLAKANLTSDSDKGVQGEVGLRSEPSGTEPGARRRPEQTTALPAPVLPPAPLDQDLELPAPPAASGIAMTSRQAPERPSLPEEPSRAREGSLLRALRTELQRARKQHDHLLDALNLDRINLEDLDRDVIARCGPYGVRVDRGQPLVQKLLATPAVDPVLVAFLASSVYSAMNRFWQEIEDDHEREFHRELTASLARCLDGRTERRRGSSP